MTLSRTGGCAGKQERSVWLEGREGHRFVPPPREAPGEAGRGNAVDEPLGVLAEWTQNPQARSGFPRLLPVELGHDGPKQSPEHWEWQCWGSGGRRTEAEEPNCRDNSLK